MKTGDGRQEYVNVLLKKKGLVSGHWRPEKITFADCVSCTM